MGVSVGVSVGEGVIVTVGKGVAVGAGVWVGKGVDAGIGVLSWVGWGTRVGVNGLQPVSERMSIIVTMTAMRTGPGSLTCEADGLGTVPWMQVMVDSLPVLVHQTVNSNPILFGIRLL
jgi:hypothetical protein